MLSFLKIWFSSTVHFYFLQYSNQMGGWGWGFFLWFNYLHPTFCQPLNFFVAPAQLSKTTLSVRLPTPSPLPHLPPTSQPPPSFLYQHLPLVHQIWDAYIIEVGEDQLETLTVALSRQQNRPKCTCVPLSIDLSLIWQVATWKLSNMINVLSPNELMEKNFGFFFPIFHTLGRTC